MSTRGSTRALVWLGTNSTGPTAGALCRASTSMRRKNSRSAMPASARKKR